MSAPRQINDGEESDRRLTRVLDEYGSVLRNAVSRVCRSFADLHRDEIEQEAKIRLWAALSRESSIVDIRRYLHRIVATAAIDAMRQVRSRRELPLEPADSESARVWTAQAADTAPSPERIAAGREIVALAREILSGVSPNRRRAVNLHLQGFTTQEIANLLGWTEAKARNLVSRGLRDVREGLRARMSERTPGLTTASEAPPRR